MSNVRIPFHLSISELLSKFMFQRSEVTFEDLRSAHRSSKQSQTDASAGSYLYGVLPSSPHYLPVEYVQ